MLCAFSTLKDFHKYVASIHENATNSKNAQILSNILLFHAQLKPVDPQQEPTQINVDDFVEDFEQSFPINSQEEGNMMDVYGIAYNPSKIKVVEDWRGLDDLFRLFPTIPKDVISKVWENSQHSWNSCFQILNSLLISHRQGDRDLSAVTLTECDLIFDDRQWPSILESLNPTYSSVVKPDEGSNDFADWTVVTMESFSRSGGGDSSFVSNESSPKASKENGPLFDWEMLKITLPTHIPIPIKLPTGMKVSYRDILLVRARERDGANSGDAVRKMQSNVRNLDSWKPLIVLGPKVPAIRQDREYVNSNHYNPYEGLTPDEIEYLKSIEEEVNDYNYDVCSNSKALSTTLVSQKRKAAVTNIRPSTLDQKMKRIAMKMKP